MQSLLEAVTFTEITDIVINWLTSTGIKIIISVLAIFVGFRIITKIARRIEKNGERFDKTVMRTVAYLFSICLKSALTICLIGYVGIDTSGLTALVASFGVCIGLAVNGALSNLAGGVLILVTRPFRVDDLIEAEGICGTVEDIHMVCTKIRTPDNKVCYVPNGSLANGNIVNYSEKTTRRLDFSFEIAYSSDTELAKKAISEILASHPKVLDDPPIFVRIGALGQSGISITARAWVRTEDYFSVQFDITESAKAALDRCGIIVPYSQLDVHIKDDR